MLRAKFSTVIHNQSEEELTQSTDVRPIRTSISIANHSPSSGAPGFQTSSRTRRWRSVTVNELLAAQRCSLFDAAKVCIE